MRVAVIIPVHQGERYLAQAIASVLAQTHRNLDLIVVDDGSTDASTAIVEAFMARDHRVRLVRQPHSGVSVARNLALKAAVGHEWIACLDHDDVMMPNRIERQLAFAAEHPDVAAFGSRAVYIDAFGDIVGNVVPVPIRSREEMSHHLATGLMIAFCAPSVMMKRDAVLEVGGYHEEMEIGEDLDLWMRLAQAGHLVLQQEEVLTQYRLHSESACAKSARESCMATQWVAARAAARRSGKPAPSRKEFEAVWRSKSLLSRIAAQRIYYTWAFYRSAGVCLACGAWFRGAGWLVAAFGLRPIYVLQRLWWQVRAD